MDGVVVFVEGGGEVGVGVEYKVKGGFSGTVLGGRM